MVSLAGETLPGKNTKDTPENGYKESDKAASGADEANCIIGKQERTRKRRKSKYWYWWNMSTTSLWSHVVTKNLR
jgi:hypothetical protein